MSERSGQVLNANEMGKQVAVGLARYERQIQASVPGAADGLLKPDRVIRLVLNEARRIPALLSCDPQSLVGAMLTSAALGLEVGSHLGHGYILPFRGVATFVPGYKGLITLAFRSGQIASLSAQVVYHGDEFRVELGTDPKIHHIPVLDSDPGAARYYYAAARLTTGGVSFMRPLTVADAKKVMAASPSASGKSSPWRTHFDEMALKTAIRRLAKILPASTELQTAVEIDDAVEGNRRPVVLPALDWLPEEAVGRPGEEIGGDDEEPRSFSGTVVDGATAQGDDR